MPALGTGRCRGRVGIVVDEIPAVHVIDESVQVIIHAVAGKLLLVHPDVRLQIGMVERNAVVHNRDGHGPVAGHPRPGSGSVDGREAPEVFVTRIVGRLAGLVHVDRLGERDACTLRRLLRRHDRVGARLQRHPQQRRLLLRRD